MRPRSNTAEPIVALLAILLALLGAYVGGYFWLGRRMDYIGLSSPSRVEAIERRYPHAWLAAIYQPAGKLEALLRRDVDVDVRYREGR